ncbi:MAG: hypothetical protein EA375_02705 [Acholeplasmataceae bacterium]|nr:MAG: hypothetical protein EA375_02705 [Acholeplasmataceae bacterium]
MKRKDLIQLIQNKADDVVIKDLSKDILARHRQQPHPAAPVMLPRPRLRMKPILSLGLLAAVITLFLVLFYPGQDTSPTFQNVDEAIVMSAFSAVTLADHAFAEALSINNRLEHNEADSLVEHEIEHLLIYLELIERIFGTPADLMRTRIEPDDTHDFSHHIRFASNSLLDEATQYDIRFNRLPDGDMPDEFTLSGELSINDRLFAIEGQSRWVMDRYVLHIGLIIDDDNRIDVTHQEEDGDTIENISITRQGNIIQSLYLKHVVDQDTREIFLHLETGLGRGTYRFTSGADNDQPLLQVHYAILRNGDRETGNIRIELITDPGSDAAYRFAIRPQGLPEIIIERGRGRIDPPGLPREHLPINL